MPNEQCTLTLTVNMGHKSKLLQPHVIILTYILILGSIEKGARYFPSPVNALTPVGSLSSAVKPDDKNVYSGTVIKVRVSQSKRSITQ